MPSSAHALGTAVRIGEVQVGARHRVPDIIIPTVSPIAILVEQFPLFLVFQTNQEVAAVELLAPG
ncbi:hypothetical protein D3C71_1953120 [compost metagenome]